VPVQGRSRAGEGEPQAAVLTEPRERQDGTFEGRMVGARAELPQEREVDGRGPGAGA
jgi:hypothetical protein